MLSRTKKIIIAGSMFGAVVVGAASAAMAAGDTDDHFSVAAGTTVTGTGTLTGGGILGGVTIAIKCPVTTHGTTPAKGLSVSVPSANISFGGANACTVTHAGTPVGNATVTAFGTWKLTEIDVDATGETTKEPNTGDKSSIVIPFVAATGGATFSSSLAPGCTVYIAGGPHATSTAPVTVKGTYNDAGKLVIPKQSIPVNPQGCPTGTSKTGSTASSLTLSPGVFDQS
jgi:hypothetical protein